MYGRSVRIATARSESNESVEKEVVVCEELSLILNFCMLLKSLERYFTPNLRVVCM